MGFPGEGADLDEYLRKAHHPSIQADDERYIPYVPRLFLIALSVHQCQHLKDKAPLMSETLRKCIRASIYLGAYDANLADQKRAEQTGGKTKLKNAAQAV